MNNHNIPASVWKVNVDVLKWFLVFTVACTCVGVVYMQWTYIWMLRAEVAEITQRFRPLDTAGKEGGICCDAAVCYGVSCYHRFLERRKHKGGRDKRDVTEQKKQRRRRQNDHDTTVLSWALGQSKGEGLQVSGDTVKVEAGGTYFIYSQVLYKDTTWVMGHVITKRLKGAETKLMKCLKSMPSNVSQPLNTCYTADDVYVVLTGDVAPVLRWTLALVSILLMIDEGEIRGIHFLESGSSLQLSVPRKSAELILTAHATFMGLFSI